MMMGEAWDSGARSVWTISQIAESLGIARHRVEYVIETRGIESIEKVGNTRIYSGDVIDVIVDSMVVIKPMSAYGGKG